MLHGSPGAGKTTQAHAVSDLLRTAEQPHAVIDLDEIGLAWPDRGRSFPRRNLAALWPEYSSVPGVKVILPSVLADASERGLLQDAVPGARFVVCELTAPVEVLMRRVVARGGDAYWQERIRGFVGLYAARSDLAAIRDFAVSTHGRTETDVAREVMAKAGWGQAADLPL